MCNKSCEGISDLLCMIAKIQKQSGCESICEGTCDRPFLGTPATCLYNTRPVTLYTCPTGTLWTMPYTTATGAEETSTVFRVENVDDCCATFRVLAPGETEGTYTSTESFFTINLNCVGAVQCLADTLVPGV